MDCSASADKYVHCHSKVWTLKESQSKRTEGFFLIYFYTTELIFLSHKCCPLLTNRKGAGALVYRHGNCPSLVCLLSSPRVQGDLHQGCMQGSVHVGSDLLWPCSYTGRGYTTIDQLASAAKQEILSIEQTTNAQYTVACHLNTLLKNQLNKPA